MRRRLLLERSAYRLLREPDATILDVAFHAGYGSHEAFTRSFTRAFGRAPSTLRTDRPRTLRELEIAAPSGAHF